MTGCRNCRLIKRDKRYLEEMLDGAGEVGARVLVDLDGVVAGEYKSPATASSRAVEVLEVYFQNSDQRASWSGR